MASSSAMLAGLGWCIGLDLPAPRIRQGLESIKSRCHAAIISVRSSPYFRARRVGVFGSRVAYHSYTRLTVIRAKRRSPRSGKIAESSSRRYSVRVRGFSSPRSVSHRSANCRKVGFARFGCPGWPSARSSSQVDASSLVSKVTGAACRRPSSPTRRACQRPEGSCRTVPVPLGRRFLAMTDPYLRAATVPLPCHGVSSHVHSCPSLYAHLRSSEAFRAGQRVGTCSIRVQSREHTSPVRAGHYLIQTACAYPVPSRTSRHLPDRR